jgi:hypothetical protein
MSEFLLDDQYRPDLIFQTETQKCINFIYLDFILISKPLCDQGRLM